MKKSITIIAMFALLFSLILPEVCAAQTTVNLVVSEDTHMRSGSSRGSYNYGSSTTIRVNPYYEQGSTDGQLTGALLKWDISGAGIPSNATVSEASITFYVTSGSNYAYSLYNMRRAWVEGSRNGATGTGASWNYYGAGTGSWGTTGAQNTSSDRYDTNLWDATATTFNTTGSVTIPLNANGVAVVQGWIAGSTDNYGLTIQDYSGTAVDVWEAASSEATTVGNRPKLNITYSVGPSITTSGTLTEFATLPGVPSAAQTYTVSGSSLTEDISITPPAGFQLSTDGSTYGSSLTLTQTSGSVPSTTVYVRLYNATEGSFSGNIAHTSSGATTQNVAASGTVSLTQTANLVSSDDGYLSTSNTSYNYGAQTYLRITLSTSTPRGSLLKWDLSSIPSNATINSVSLTVNVSTAAAATYYLYGMRQAWIEGTGSGSATGDGATWLTYDGTSTWGTSGAANTTTDRYDVNLWGAGSSTFSSTGSKTVDLNSNGIALVQGWVDGSVSNNGLTIQNYGSSSTAYDLQISSNNNATAANRPKLNISYTVVIGPNIVTSGTLIPFTSQPGVPSAAQTYSVSGANLTDDITITPPSGFELSIDGSLYSSSLTLTQSGGTVSPKTVYVRLASATEGTFTGSIAHASAGATTKNLPASGTVAYVYALTAGNDGNGTVALSPPGGSYSNGTTVTLTPVPGNGYAFSSWSGANAADIINTSGVYTILINGDKSVTANFVQGPFWTVYDDMVYSSSDPFVGKNVNRFGYTTTSGTLRKQSDSSSTGVTVTVTASGTGNSYTSNGDNTNSGTDAYATFYSIASMVGVRNYGTSTSWYVDVKFSGLDPEKEYTFVTSANRDDADYPERLSAFIIQDVDSYTQASTAGASISGDTVRFSTGYNTVNGYVARWTNIKCGSDGDFTVRTRTGGTGDDNYGYGPSVFMLQENWPVPVTIPNAPTDLAATVLSHTQIKLDWTDNSNNERKFYIERSTDGGGGPFTLIDSANAGVPTYINTGLTPSTEYYYRVYAVNAVGSSDYSNLVSGMTNAPPVQRTLTLTVIGDGCSVTKSPDNATYDNGTVVTVAAVPADGWEFYCWLGALSGSENPTTITMSEDRAVTATFVQTQGWKAYNDCVYRAAEQYIGKNVTRYGVGSGFSGSTSGLLYKHLDSSSTGITVALTQSGGVNWQADVEGGGSDPNSGTDAYETFHGIADMLGVIYYASSSGWYVDATFTGLDPDKEYTFATSANRDSSTYTTRVSAFVIGGVTSYTHTSTPGATISGDTVRFCTGYNTVNGYVARWSDIKPGSDGSFTVRAKAAGTVNQAYAFSVFMLQEEANVPPPAAPTALNATPTALGTHIALTWSDNSGDELVFAVERSTDAGIVWSTLRTVGVNTTSLTDSNLAAGSTYHYRVRAGNGGGYSDYSNTANATISHSPDPPVVVVPLNEATGVSTSPNLQVSISDPDADAMTVSFVGGPKVSGGVDFTLVVLPDLQNMTQSYPTVLNSMTQWVADNKSSSNIAFATQTGDLVNTSSSATQWGNVDAAFDILDAAGVPYSVGPGNHDLGGLYETYFGVSRFTGKSWYGGHYGSDNLNNYSLFSASGSDFIVINLQYSAGTAILDWADALLKANADRRGIVVQHDILNVNDSWVNQASFTALKDNPNLFLMLCGHMHAGSDGAAYRAELGDDGHTIHVVQADYQDFANGGNGWLRILRFSPTDDVIYMTTYSPYTSGSITTDPDQKNLVYDLDGESAVFELIGTVTGASSGSTASVSWPTLLTSTTYDWYVTVSDGHTTTTGATWSFTTGTETAPTDVITATQPNTDYASAETGVTLNFATLPAGGGEVTITRHNSVPPAPPTYELPPGSAAYLPVWLEITTTIPDHAFAVEVTLDLSGVTGFDANSAVMCYNEITDSWIPMAGTYAAGSPNTFTFTATHFTPFGFVTKPTPSYNLFVGNTADATSAGVKAPNSTWRSVTPPSGGYNGEDDWSWTGAQSVTFYLVPQTSTIFKAADIMLEWDKSIMTHASTAFTGIPFSTSSATLQGSEDQLLIHVEGSADITTDSYIAAVTFTLLKPGHSPLLVIGSDFTKDPALSVFVTPYQGEVKAYLGDFATTTGPDYTQGDGKLDITDLSPWSSSYWSGVEGGPGMTNYKSKFDIGPTASGYVYTLPTMDAKIDFEDLVVFSISYGLSKQYQLPKAPVESKEPLMIASSATTGTGAETRIPVTVSGGVVDLRAMSLVLSGRFGKFLGVEKGALLQPYATPVMLMSRTEGSRVYVDMAIMGSDVEALNGEGEVLVLRFDGKSTVAVTKADCRTSVNTAIATEIKDAPVAIPTSFGLSQNYPNPFNPSTVLEYQVPTPAQVEISVYNLLGEKVATLVNEVKEPGYHSITWNATGANGQTVATGIYFYRMHAGDFVSTKRMLLVK